MPDRGPHDKTTDATRAIDTTLPEVVQRFLRAGAQLESIRLDGNGRWWHEGALIEHPRVLALFARSIDRTEGGTWVLRIPPFTYPIEVDATPLFITSASPIDEGRGLKVSLSDGREEVVETRGLRYVEGGGLHAPVGDGRFEARFILPVYVEFASSYIVQDEAGEFVVKVGETQHRLQIVPTDAT